MHYWRRCSVMHIFAPKFRKFSCMLSNSSAKLAAFFLAWKYITTIRNEFYCFNAVNWIYYDPIFHRFSVWTPIKYSSFYLFITRTRKCAADIMNTGSTFIQIFNKCFVMASSIWIRSWVIFPHWTKSTSTSSKVSGSFSSPNIFPLPIFFISQYFPRFLFKIFE